MTENIDNKLMLPDEIIMNKIYFIRGEKVMLDSVIPNCFVPDKFFHYENPFYRKIHFYNLDIC
ncbi:MAG: hypothetical protein H8E98_03790 [Bacteroidetes bacterium]|nr:hypothetical protein [Bacteroidota bacterium]